MHTYQILVRLTMATVLILTAVLRWDLANWRHSSLEDLRTIKPLSYWLYNARALSTGVSAVYYFFAMSTVFQVLFVSSRRAISPMLRPLPNNTQHSQKTDIHDPSWIRIGNSRKPAAQNLRLKMCSHQDHLSRTTTYNENLLLPCTFLPVHYSPYPSILCSVTEWVTSLYEP